MLDIFRYAAFRQGGWIRLAESSIVIKTYFNPNFFRSNYKF